MTAYQGVRIVDFSQGMVGPMAAMLLGDFGAEIVKVEPPGGDRLKDHPGYLAWNRNKQVATLDLEAEAGIAAAHTLIAGADVALFDLGPTRLKALGLDADRLTAKYPKLVHAWMPPYGTSGRWSDLPGHHSLLAALTAMPFRQGAWGDTPVHMVLPIAHSSQAVLGATAIGAALFERTLSGMGQAVTVSGLHGSAECAPPMRFDNIEPLPRGTPPGANPRYRLYKCADDEWFFLGTLFTNFYRKAFEALELGDLFEVLEQDMVGAREMLIGIFETRPRDEWLTLLQAHDVPCAPVRRREVWMADEAVAEAGMRLVFDHPVLGEVAMPAPPARLSATPARIAGLPRAVRTPPAWPSKIPAAAEPRRSGPPLAGIKVLNLGTVIAGAYAGTILANLGAEVIKIEGPEADPFRSDGSQFLVYNRGVRGLGLDLKQTAARDTFLDMVRSADVVIDNYRLGVRDRLGITYPALKAINPRIISCSINAYGDSGSRAALPGFDPLMQSEGGMMAAQGGGDDPVLYTIAVNDIATAAVVSAAVVAALNARETTGEGQEIVSSLLAQSLLYQLGDMVDYAGRPAGDLGGRDCLGLRALHRYYPCVDGWIALACETQAEAGAVGQVLGIDIDSDALTAARDGDLAIRVEAALASRARDEMVDALLTAGAVATPVRRFDEALQDPWLWDNGHMAPWTHPRLGPGVSARTYADFSRTPGGFKLPTPDLGEHTRQVLADYGVPQARVTELMATGAAFVAPQA
ncbi:CaiB/BaiF CoA transferase family protein [Phenylobacterium sp.]|jgi:crotonobetainyl-CoA:carnitine CoA-transferase CaiB-like acyl-CoA transferase|uniref:CaiB/BaiF CoA transferase family protein n=1 Tax=Phenylobacterium sp. TaxID=1871053 RepID=UPI0037CADC8E